MADINICKKCEHYVSVKGVKDKTCELAVFQYARDCVLYRGKLVEVLSTALVKIGPKMKSKKSMAKPKRSSRARDVDVSGMIDMSKVVPDKDWCPFVLEQFMKKG